jgi:hypothetical protein
MMITCMKLRMRRAEMYGQLRTSQEVTEIVESRAESRTGGRQGGDEGKDGAAYLRLDYFPAQNSLFCEN